MKLEMRTLKNIAAAAMTLAVVFGASSLKPVTANAAEASVSVSIEEENSYISFQDEAYQNEFLRRVNNERAKAGLKPVQPRVTLGKVQQKTNRRSNAVRMKRRGKSSPAHG